jgi:hypothetical protein
MKKLRFIFTVLAILISMFMCFDEVFASHMNADPAQIPSDCSGVFHHHQLATADHFFQFTTVSDSGSESTPDTRLLRNDQSLTDFYCSTIWQPPKTN